MGFDTTELSVISLSKLNAEDLNEDANLLNACMKDGIFYLSFDGAAKKWSTAAVDGLFETSKRFFALPLSKKNLVSWERTGTYFGYKHRGAAVVDRSGTLDSNEFLNISKEEALRCNSQVYLHHGLLDENAASHAKSFVTHAHEALFIILKSLTRKLEVDLKDDFTLFHRIEAPSGDHMRLIRYTLEGQKKNEQGVLLIPHTDFGTLTLLLSNNWGLQIFDATTQQWRYVAPKPNSAVVNVGDALVKFTNGLLHSCLHRSIDPTVDHPGDEQYIKYSLGYFLRPEDDVPLKVVKGRCIPQPERPEKPILSKEWIAYRVNASKVATYKRDKDWNSVQGTASGWSAAA